MSRVIVTKNGYASDADMARELRTLNPFVVAWLRAHGLAYSEIYQPGGQPGDLIAESKRVTIAGESLPWGVHYVQWISRQWEAWARSLGFTQRASGQPTLACTALINGYTARDFETWLLRTFPLVKACKCGRCFTVDAWRTLPYVGEQPGTPPLEMRNCICGSTLTIDKE